MPALQRTASFVTAMLDEWRRSKRASRRYDELKNAATARNEIPQRIFRGFYARDRGAPSAYAVRIPITPPRISSIEIRNTRKYATR